MQPAAFIPRNGKPYAALCRGDDSEILSLAPGCRLEKLITTIYDRELFASSATTTIRKRGSALCTVAQTTCCAISS
jgi:hypothetical protein